VRELERHRRAQHYPLLLGIFLAPWCQWFQGTFDVWTHWMAPNVTLWMNVGLALAFCNLPPDRDVLDTSDRCARERVDVFVKPSLWVKLLALLMVGLVYFCLVMVHRFWRADHLLRENMAFTEANIGTLPAALEQAEEAERIAHHDVSIKYKLAYTYLVAGRMHDAMRTYRALQALAPNYAQIHINLAFLNDQLGDSGASAWERDRAAAIEHNTRNHRDAAQHWQQLGYPLRALAHLRSCFTIERDRTLDCQWIHRYQYDEIHAELAGIYKQLGDTDAAYREARAAVTINPANLEAVAKYLEILHAMGKNLAADSVAVQLAKLQADAPRYLLLAVARAISAGRYEEGLQELDKVVFMLSPAPMNQQVSSAASALPGATLPYIQKIYEAGVDQGHCLDLAGWLFAYQGDFSKASELLGAAYAQNKSPATAERLARVKARLGRAGFLQSATPSKTSIDFTD